VDAAGTTRHPANNGKTVEPWHSLYHAPLTDPSHKPRAWRLDTDLAQVYEVPELLTPEECTAMIAVIDKSLGRSTVTQGPSDYRTSRTCHMRRAKPEMMQEIDARIAHLIHRDPAFSEQIQGQRYDIGEFFKAHTDWFAPNTDEFTVHAKVGGQRTWTVMVYLNHVAGGGNTRFERIGREFKAIAGSAIAWNNLEIDGAPNHATLHEALPVIEGRNT
jgi:prolyl 4-hydroxylase